MGSNEESFALRLPKAPHRVKLSGKTYLVLACKEHHPLHVLSQIGFREAAPDVIQAFEENREEKQRVQAGSLLDVVVGFDRVGDGPVDLAFTTTRCHLLHRSDSDVSVQESDHVDIIGLCHLVSIVD